MERIPPLLNVLTLILAATGVDRAMAEPAPPEPPAPSDAAGTQSVTQDPLGDYLDQVRAQRRAQHERLRAESRSESERARREQREAADEHRRAHREQAEQRRDPAQPGPANPPGWGNPWYFQGW
jgi:hypothetical protein